MTDLVPVYSDDSAFDTLMPIIPEEPVEYVEPRPTTTYDLPDDYSTSKNKRAYSTPLKKTNQPLTMYDLHDKLNHTAGWHRMMELLNKNLLKGTKIVTHLEDMRKVQNCKQCLQGKAQRHPLPTQSPLT
jgi:hypothetical protein